MCVCVCVCKQTNKQNLKIETKPNNSDLFLKETQMQCMKNTLFKIQAKVIQHKN